MDLIHDVIIEETSRFEKNFDKLPLQVAKHFRQTILPTIVSCIRERTLFPNSLRAKYVEGSKRRVCKQPSI